MIMALFVCSRLYFVYFSYMKIIFGLFSPIAHVENNNMPIKNDEQHFWCFIIVNINQWTTSFENCFIIEDISDNQNCGWTVNMFTKCNVHLDKQEKF